MPVVKGLVAEHPVPLTVDGVVDSHIGVDLVRGIVGIHALGAALVSVAVRSAVPRNHLLVDEGCITGKGFLETYTIGIRGDFGAGCDVLDGVAELVEAGVVGIEGVRLP